MAAQPRRPTQDFTGILNFIPEDLYSLLSSPNCQQEERRTAILEFAVGLGLRCPSERTMALLTAMEQYRGTGQFVNSFQLHSALESTKTAFRRLVRGAADPNPFMVHLPQNPGQLPAGLQQALLPQGAHAVPQMHVNGIMALVQRVPLRKTHTEVQAVTGAAKEAAVPQLMGLGSALLGGIMQLGQLPAVPKVSGWSSSAAGAVPAVHLQTPAPLALPAPESAGPGAAAFPALEDAPRGEAAEDFLRAGLPQATEEEQEAAQPSLLQRAHQLVDAQGKASQKGKPSPAQSAQGQVSGHCSESKKKGQTKKGLRQKPAAAVPAPKKRPAGSQLGSATKKRPQAAPAALKSASSGGHVLSQTRKCVLSRAYHKAFHAAMHKTAGNTEKSKEAARKAMRVAAQEFDA
ncbi:unnamed protein product [Symbiodinium sp. CCMP2592]|nr:unnamed protein product [Symbiodinium sp. CCMP2592]CAE7460209.1 unnamed protein product [Symbiodinium sp. CCMP2592]